MEPYESVSLRRTGQLLKGATIMVTMCRRGRGWAVSLSLSLLPLIAVPIDSKAVSAGAKVLSSHTNLNPLSKAEKATLTVTMHLDGAARQNGGDPGTWYATKVDRRLTVQIPMTALGSAPVSLLAGDTGNLPVAAQIGDSDQQQIQRLMAGVEAEAARCGEDDTSCQMSAAMLLSAELRRRNGNGSLKALTTAVAQADPQRFQNWVAAQPCVKGGSIRVTDDVDATELDPATGAFRASYKIRGETSLPAEPEANDGFCGTTVSIDQRTGLYAIRLTGTTVPLVLRRTGSEGINETWDSNFAGPSSEIDEQKRHLTFRDIKAESAILSGERRIAAFAVLSDHWGGTETPVTADVTWRLTAD